MENAVKFLENVMAEIEVADPKHAKTLRNFEEKETESVFYDEIRTLICEFFRKKGIDASKAASDYLKMINDMRAEMIYFILRGSYSCKGQHEAFKNVYSKPEVMSYYMNALVLSQILWRHHFKMLQFFINSISPLYEASRWSDVSILEVGAGHGLYSYICREELPIRKIDIVDVSSEALQMTKTMIGDKKIRYIQKDIQFYSSQRPYDMIIMGEVLEHLDYPESILHSAYDMLDDDGVLWITVPTNAPAIDHVYLFRDKQEVVSMVSRTGFRVFDHYDIRIEGETSLIGMFCVKK